MGPDIIKTVSGNRIYADDVSVNASFSFDYDDYRGVKYINFEKATSETKQ